MNTNNPDKCLCCGNEYDLLITTEDMEEMQSQGKCNICIAHHSKNGTFVFVHFAEKYL